MTNETETTRVCEIGKNIGRLQVEPFPRRDLATSIHIGQRILGMQTSLHHSVGSVINPTDQFELPRVSGLQGATATLRVA